MTLSNYLTLFALTCCVVSAGVVPWVILYRLRRVERCIAVLALELGEYSDDGDPPDDDPGEDCDVTGSADVVAIGRRAA